MPFTETAYAKINLALHVRARRADGYHQLETLFAFVDAGDWLSAEPDDHDTVISRGEFGGVLDDPLANIVMQALAEDGAFDGTGATAQNFRAMVLPDTYLDHDKPDRLYAQAGLDARAIVAKVLGGLGRSEDAATSLMA